MAEASNKLYLDGAKAIETYIDAQKKLETQLNESLDAKKKLIEQQKILNKALLSADGAKEFAAAQKQVEANIKLAAKAEKESIEIQKKGEQLKREKVKTSQAEAREILKTKKAQDNYNETLKQADSAYRKASMELTAARNKAKDLGQTYGVTSKQFRQAANDVRVLDANLKKIDSAVGQNQRSVGNYGKALGGVRGTLMSVAGALGFVGGIQMITKAFKDGIETARNYEKANAELAGVLGKQRKDTVALQKESKRLGSTTAFTASEVTALQIELARLGKSEEDIIASTEGIIDATVALGSETAETAALVGSTLNTFKLGAEESSKVADILTLSTQRSALSFEKLNTALPIAGGAAAAAGVKLETVVAQLGQAADRGIDASTAATSLRNIYIKLAEKGLTLEQALAKINGSQDKLTESVEIFGVRAAVTGLALAETTGKTEELTAALEDAGGTAKRVAEEQLNTLDGSLRLLSSAYEGLVLEIFKTDGAIKLVDGLSAAINNLVKSFKTIDELSSETSDSIIGAIKASGGSAEEQLARLNKSIGISQEGIATLEKQRADLLSRRATGAGLVDPKEIRELAVEIQKQQKILETFNNFRAQLNEQAAIERIDLTSETTEELIKWEGLYTNSFAALTQDQIRRLKAIQLELKRRNDLVEEGTEIVVSATNEQIGALNKLSAAIELPKDLSKDVADSILSDDLKIAASAVRKSDKIIEEAQRAADKVAEIEAARAETELALKEGAFESAGILSDQFFANSQMRRDEETQAQIDAMNQRLENDTLDAEQRELIQKQIAEKEKKLKTDQAKADKKAAIIQSVVNTALAIGKTAATLGFPAAIPFIAFAAATGLAQTIAIASQPLPKFDKGTKNFPGLGEVAERRPELVVNRGVTELFTKPTILGSDYKGAEIIGGADTAKLLDQANRAQLVNGVSKNSSKIDTLQMELSFEKMMDKHTNRMVNELRKNRPIKQSANDYRADYSRNKYGA